MASVNKVLIIGNLGKDPEIRYTPSGTAMANITVATSEQWKDKQTNEKRENTEWHRVIFFNRLAEIVGEYLKKGSKVYVEGRLQTRKWQDKNGQDRYTTEIVAGEMKMLDSRGGGQSGGENSGFSGQNRAAPNQDSGAAPAAQQAPSAYNEFDDDIPF